MDIQTTEQNLYTSDAWCLPRVVENTNLNSYDS
jgi:hypothetical protein